MISVKFEGGQDMLRRLQQLPERASKTVQRNALKAGAEPMRAQMEVNVLPRGKSLPEDSRIVIRNAKAQDAQEVAIAVGPTNKLFYGFEFGTKHQPARPFARPAFDQTVYKALSIISAKMWEQLRKKLPGSFGGSSIGRGGQFE